MINEKQNNYCNAVVDIEWMLDELNDWSLDDGVWTQTPYYLEWIVELLEENNINATLGTDNTIIVNGVTVYMYANGYENDEKTYAVWKPIQYEDLCDEYK